MDFNVEKMSFFLESYNGRLFTLGEVMDRPHYNGTLYLDMRSEYHCSSKYISSLYVIYLYLYYKYCSITVPCLEEHAVA